MFKNYLLKIIGIPILVGAMINPASAPQRRNLPESRLSTPYLESRHSIYSLSPRDQQKGFSLIDPLVSGGENEPTYNPILAGALRKAYSSIRKPYYLSEDLVQAIMFRESSNNPKSRSKKGARGLMQMTPLAWNDAGESRFHETSEIPEKNILAGIKYLLWIDAYCEKFHPRWESLPETEKVNFILASNNGGAARLKSRGWNINKMPPETRHYVKSINRYLGRKG